MSAKKKVGMSLLMGLGVFASWTSIYKCTKLPALANRADYLCKPILHIHTRLLSSTRRIRRES